MSLRCSSRQSMFSTWAPHVHSLVAGISSTALCFITSVKIHKKGTTTLPLTRLDRRSSTGRRLLTLDYFRPLNDKKQTNE